MAIKGSLREASLADVCQLLALGGKTGCLSVTDRSNFGQIYFDRGRVTYARIVNRRDRLGDLLVGAGIIDHATLQDAVAEQGRRPEARLGQILLERSRITRDQLERFIRLQIQEAIYYLFTWSRGSFFFESDERPDDADILVAINPETLLLEGARRVDEWSVIEKKIPSLDLVFRIDHDRLRGADVELTESQRQIIPFVDGHRTLRDVADVSGLVEFEVGKAVYGLLQAGFAVRSSRRAAPPLPRAREAEIEEHRNLGVAFFRSGLHVDARREFERVLTLRAEDRVARLHLALIALHERRWIEALRRLKRIVETTGPSYFAFYHIAVALAGLGRDSEALLALGQAEERGAERPEVPLLRASIHLRSGAARAAEDDLRAHRSRLGAAVPGAAYFHALALAHALRGRLADADAVVAEGLSRHPDSSPLLVLAGCLAERRGDLDEAENMNRRAAEEDPALPQAQKNLGDIAYRRGQHEEALDHFRRAVRLAPALGDDVYARLGNLHFKRRETEAAVASWRRALELNPDNDVVRKNLEVAGHAR